MYEHQDWNTVIINKSGQKAATLSKPLVQKQPKYLSQLNENDNVAPPKQFDRTYIAQVIKARLDKKLTQKDLASLVNEDVNRINRFEQGKEVYDHKLKSKLNRHLGITNAN